METLNSEIQTSHFGKPAQPFAKESMEWLNNTILGKTVHCQLVQRDQYSRVVRTQQRVQTLMLIRAGGQCLCSSLVETILPRSQPLARDAESWLGHRVFPKWRRVRYYRRGGVQKTRGYRKVSRHGRNVDIY